MQVSLFVKLESLGPIEEISENLKKFVIICLVLTEIVDENVTHYIFCVIRNAAISHLGDCFQRPIFLFVNTVFFFLLDYFFSTSLLRFSVTPILICKLKFMSR